MVKREKKGDDPKSKEKDSNTGGTAGAQVEDTTTLGGSTLGMFQYRVNIFCACPAHGS